MAAMSWLALVPRKMFRMRFWPTRCAAPFVDVIDIRYWAYTAGDGLYAPEGGRNLAPRQHLRQTKLRPGGFEAIAKAVREYRTRFPDKAVTYYADMNCPSSRDGLGRPHRWRLVAKCEIARSTCDNHSHTTTDGRHRQQQWPILPRQRGPQLRHLHGHDRPRNRGESSDGIGALPRSLGRFTIQAKCRLAKKSPGLARFGCVRNRTCCGWNAPTRNDATLLHWQPHRHFRLPAVCPSVVGNEPGFHFALGADSQRAI